MLPRYNNSFESFQYAHTGRLNPIRTHTPSMLAVRYACSAALLLGLALAAAAAAPADFISGGSLGPGASDWSYGTQVRGRLQGCEQGADFRSAGPTLQQPWRSRHAQHHWARLVSPE